VTAVAAPLAWRAVPARKMSNFGAGAVAKTFKFFHEFGFKIFEFCETFSLF
jgi:hypothetical protein